MSTERVVAWAQGITHSSKVITPTSVAEQLMYSTIRIANPPAVGTGFYYNHVIDETTAIGLIITNKHVITGDITELTFHTTKGEGKPSGSLYTAYVDNTKGLWIHHPSATVDLCALPIGPIFGLAEKAGHTLYTVAMGSKLIWSDKDLTSLDAVEEVIMVGYPNGLWDDVNNYPLFRRGITATHPASDYRGTPVTVIDIATVGGSSGSPVLIINSPLFSRKYNAQQPERGNVLLGVLYAGPVITQEGEIITREIPTGFKSIVALESFINLGFIVKAKEILVLAKHVESIFRDLTRGN